MISNMQNLQQRNNSSSCTAPVTSHNSFEVLSIGHIHNNHIDRSNTMHRPNQIDNYAGIITDKNELVISSKSHTKDNSVNGISNNQETVTFYLLKSINNNNNNIHNNNNDKFKTLTNDVMETDLKIKSEISDGDARYSCDQLKLTSSACNRSETEDNDSNESATIDVGREMGDVTDLHNGSGVSGDEKAPDHHARRPMNAFLIFCKKHRGIVREKYPNLENRSITKILGDWWANLEKDDKVCYTNLAKQYKDAFFTANPNFKWYKLPAPPLRTLSIGTRPIYSERHDSLSDLALEYEYTTLSAVSKKLNGVSEIGEPVPDDQKNNIQTNKSNVGIFKLADETQMGGLNSLMMAVEVVTSIDDIKNENKNENDQDQEMLDRQEALHRELSVTRSFMERTINGKAEDVDIFSTVRYQTKLKQQPQQNSDKIIPSKNNFYKNSNGHVKFCELDYYEDHGCADRTAMLKKSSRACKGKRYIEFMSAHKLSPFTKKTKTRSTSTSSSSLSPTENLRNGKFLSNANINVARKMDYEISDHLYANHTANISMPISNEIPIKQETELDGKAVDTDANKFFDAKDFDLEKKIRALPARNLEDYLSRKRDTKKKKKINGKHSVSNGGINKKNFVSKSAPAISLNNVPPPKTIQEAKERLMMVGSQKRKARKESITRRDIKPIAISKSIHINATGDDSENSILNLRNNSTTLAPNLLILATMAEAAAANFSV